MKVLRLLCFGDSITHGYPSGHSYALALQKSLQREISHDYIVINEQGRNGDMVISPPGLFYPRLEDLYDDTTIFYDWAIILGGTNDLTQKFSASPIFSALRQIWRLPLSNGTKVLALTVPECGSCNPYLDHKRDALNEMILTYEAENLYTFDLHEELPWHKMPENERRVIWEDGLHLTEKGYDLMGNLIAMRLIEIMEKELYQAEIDSDSGVVQRPLRVSNPDDRDP